MSSRAVRWAFFAAAVYPSFAAAQAIARKPAAPAKPPADAVTGVTVTAPGQEFRSSIDRRSYSLGKDLQATNGSVGDVLRNVPSVEVDVQGNVSLRGDPNVTIMVDGKPSGQFRAETRAQALQSLPAGQVDRIEVITNPSAAFNPEGSAGIINIVMKPVRKPGYSGSARAMAGSRERYSFGLSGAYNAPKLVLSADLNFRGDPLPFRYQEVRQQRAGAAFEASHDTRVLAGHGHILNGKTSVDYDLDAASHLTGQLRRIRLAGFQDGFEQFASETAGGAPGPAFDSAIGRSPYIWKDSEISGSWRRTFAGEDHNLLVSARREWSDNDFRRPDRLTRLQPAAPDLFEQLHTIQDQTITDLKAEYARPLPGDARLKAGAEWQVDLNDYANVVGRGAAPETLTDDPALTGQFLYRQSIASAYATYERPLGPLTVLAGLRVETVHIDIGQNSGPLTRANTYRRTYPSLHLAYALAEGQKLTASYGRRVERPKPFDVNPLRLFQDPLNFFVGDPRLKPQETDSFELGYEFKRGSNYELATLFYRRTTEAITEVVTDLGGGVLLHSRANLGETRSGGLELVSNGKLTSKLSYNLSSDLYWNQINAANLGFAGARSGYAVSGRANLTWQATDRDLLQANMWLIGRRLTPQGYRQPIGVLNLGYRRKVRDDLFATLTVQDALNSFKDVVVIDTPTLHDRLERRVNPTVVNLSLTWNFGGAGKKPRDPAFEFGGAPPP